MPNYDKMWTMLERFQFEIDQQSMIHVKCIVCNNLLIDAYQGICGCNFCKKCIDKFLTDGRLTCPSESNDCAMDNFKIDKDNSANKRVSKLLVKCPSNICEFTCELIQMCSHLEICDNFRRPCPFNEFGCIVNKMDEGEMTDHLENGLLSHNSMITEWMTNTKNDLTAGISRQVIRNEFIDIEQIIKLKITDQRKTDESKTNDLLNEIENIKRKNEELKWLIDEIVSKLIKEIDQLKAEKVDLVKQINEEKENIKNIKKKLEGEVGYNCCCKNKFATTKDVVDLTDLSRKTSCKTSENSTREIGNLHWLLSDISKLSEPWGTPSEKFYSTNQCYEMRLRLWLEGCRDKHKSTHICIEYTVTNADVHNESDWPITCQVSILIKPISGQSESRVLKQELLIFKEPNYDFDLFSPWSPQFHFRISDLKQASVIRNDSIFIECHVSIIS